MIAVSILFTLHLYIYTSHGKELGWYMFASFILATYVQIAINNNARVYKPLMIVLTYTSLLLLSLQAPHTMPIMSSTSPATTPRRHKTYCSGTIIYCGVCVCRAAAALSASPQVTNTVYTRLRDINVTPWKVESVK